MLTWWCCGIRETLVESSRVNGRRDWLLPWGTDRRSCVPQRHRPGSFVSVERPILPWPFGPIPARWAALVPSHHTIARGRTRERQFLSAGVGPSRLHHRGVLRREGGAVAFPSLIPTFKARCERRDFPGSVPDPVDAPSKGQEREKARRAVRKLGRAEVAELQEENRQPLEPAPSRARGSATTRPSAGVLQEVPILRSGEPCLTYRPDRSANGYSSRLDCEAVPASIGRQSKLRGNGRVSARVRAPD